MQWLKKFTTVAGSSGCLHTATFILPCLHLVFPFQLVCSGYRNTAVQPHAVTFPWSVWFKCATVCHPQAGLPADLR